MPNHLTRENSPYLLQHAENPVEWYPWGEVALQRAREEDKPIFLSIGYAACHWCHVMAHESFENAETAAVMNAFFINIKVDREERPDLDSIYMQAVVSLSGQGGWPMSVFLAPDTRPIYGGTYYPPEARFNLPGFRDLLRTIASLWASDREKLLSNANLLTAHLTRMQNDRTDQTDQSTLTPELLPEASRQLAETYNWKTGGWGGAPRFPHPLVIEFSLLQAARGDQTAREMAFHALHAMARGGMYDVLGGGFARYSVDENWRVPHFEKMLYDNALLARTYLHAYLVSGDTKLRRVCEETLDFVLREMTHPLGGFFSSLDADSEGMEGRFYTWTQDEIENALPDDQDSSLFYAAYDLQAEGDLNGRHCLRRLQDNETLALHMQSCTAEIDSRLERIRSQLFEARSTRIRPAVDDKVLLSWNAWMLTTLAEAGRYLQRADYLEAARRNASFLLDHMYTREGLQRSWRQGTSRHAAYLEDHAALILALLALYQSDPETRWFASALKLADDLETFRDEQGNYCDTGCDQNNLFLRPRDTQDNATPSGSALAATALLQLSTYQGRGDWRQTAEGMIVSMIPEMRRFPTAFGQWLCAADFAIGPVQEVAIVGDPGQVEFQEMAAAVWETFRPRLLAAFSSGPGKPDQPALLKDRTTRGKTAAAYVCQGFQCRQPVHTAAALAGLLKGA